MQLDAKFVKIKMKDNENLSVRTYPYVKTRDITALIFR